MRSLPENCKFSIISFGTTYEFLDQDEDGTYNDETRDAAISEIEIFDADFGGTNILEPLKEAQTHFRDNKHARIFLLTDGQVNNRDAVINQAGEHSDEIRVFTFGLGEGCDEHLVTETARAGRGTATMVRDGGEGLKADVIRALSRAMEPSL